ncbi:MAG: class II aldolase/adducin family protein [bacterium]
MKKVIVSGKWNDDGGRPSGYATKLIEGLGDDWIALCGGTWQELQEYAIPMAYQADILIWMPDVPNNKTKHLNTIKKVHPKCILVSSKNNRQNKYNFKQLIGRALKSKSNLLIEFTEDEDGLIEASVFDPLGNAFCYKENNPQRVGRIINNRVNRLVDFTRIGSKQVGNKIEVPNEDDLFNLVHQYADTFHKLIHGANPERFMGNVSFRCTFGFPSFRHNNMIFVSRRNIDKRLLGRKGFVGVNLNPDKVEYYGEYKASVDTPIQIRIYNYYQKINYILHSHTYIEGAPFTHEIIPCGAVEEAKEVTSYLPDSNIDCAYLNLKGHGSIALANKVEQLQNIPYMARNIPEIV